MVCVTTSQLLFCPGPVILTCIPAWTPCTQASLKGRTGDDLTNAGLARNRGQAEIWRLWLLHADEYGSKHEELQC